MLHPARHGEPNTVAKDEEGAVSLRAVKLRRLEGRHPGGDVDGHGDGEAPSQHQQPVMVKTIELKERVNKDKVKIRSVNEIQHELSFDVCIFYIYSFTF